MNLKELIKNIKFKKSLIESLEELKKYNSSDWEIYKLNTHKDYEKNCIYRNKNIEIFLITWNKNKKSLIHDHSENGCLYKVLQGSIIEKRFNKELIQIDEKQLNKDEIGYIDNNYGYHSMHNLEEITYSLHIYSPPNYKMNIYNNI